ARDRAAARRVRVVPVLHVVLLSHAGGARVADVIIAQEILDLDGGGPVDEIPAPHLGLMWSAGMPGGDRAGLAWVQGRIGEDLARAANQPRPLAPLLAPLFLAMREIFGDDRGMLIGGRDRPVAGEQIDAGLVAALIKRDLQPSSHRPLLHVAAPAPAGTD